MIQLTLDLSGEREAALEAAWKAAPPCAFGVPWRQHFEGNSCPACEAESARLQAAFDAAVASGEYDRQGYTPAERRALQRRAT